MQSRLTIIEILLRDGFSSIVPQPEAKGNRKTKKPRQRRGKEGQNYRPRFSVVCWPYSAKCSASAFRNLNIVAMVSFHFDWGPQPGPWAINVKGSVYLSPMHSAKSTRYSAMVLQSALNSFFMQLHLLFPGLWPKIMACSISACQSLPAGVPDRKPMGSILAADYEQIITKWETVHEFWRFFIQKLQTFTSCSYLPPISSQLIHDYCMAFTLLRKLFSIHPVIAYPLFCRNSCKIQPLLSPFLRKPVCRFLSTKSVCNRFPLMVE